MKKNFKALYIFGLLLNCYASDSNGFLDDMVSELGQYTTESGRIVKVFDQLVELQQDIPTPQLMSEIKDIKTKLTTLGDDVSGVKDDIAATQRKVRKIIEVLKAQRKLTKVDHAAFQSLAREVREVIRLLPCDQEHKDRLITILSEFPE